MDHLDTLNKEQLRQLLNKYGIKQPLTDTTRKVLISRLRACMLGQIENTEQMRRGSNNLTRYSSGEEESDRENAHNRGGTRRSVANSSTASTRLSTATSTRSSTARDNQQRMQMPPPSDTSKYKRATTAIFSSPASNTSSSSSNNHSKINQHSSGGGSCSNSYSVKVPIQGRQSVYIPPPIHSSDTDDSEAGGSHRTSFGQMSTSSKRGMSSIRLSGFSFPKRYSPQPDTIPPPSARSTLIYDGSRSRNSFNNTSLDRHSSDHSSASISSYGNNSPLRHLSDSHNNNGSLDADESPYANEFTKRLLQFRGRNLKADALDQSRRSGKMIPPQNHRSYSRFDSEIVHQATDGHSRGSYGSSFKNLLRNAIFRLDEQYSGFQPTIVPCVLVGALILFFIFLLFMYLTITPDLVNALQAKHTIHVACQDLQHTLDGSSTVFRNTLDGHIGGACIESNDDLEAALNLLRLIAPELQRRIVAHKCQDANQVFMVDAREVVRMALKGSGDTVHESEVHRNLHNMEYLISANPQWHIDHVNKEGMAITFDQVLDLRPHFGNAFAILHPRLPLSCLFFNKLHKFFFVIGSLTLASAAVYLINAAYRYSVRVKQERRNTINRLISQIIQILMDQAMKFQHNAEASLIVVNHLRDQLIEPAQRGSMNPLWLEAMDFLERNESRIQFEMRSRNGEYCRMVRWVDTIKTQHPSMDNNNPLLVPNFQHATAPNNNTSNNHSAMDKVNASPLLPHMVHPGAAATASTSNLYNSAQLSRVGESMMTVKRWQSPAFDNSNKIPSPPTQCLKIRQMFDKFEAANATLQTTITDAILEKVGAECTVYDIQLEKQTCCVYVRCATKRDAGLVHDAINGWWFDHRLVSIKFLRLDRYLTRFPSSTATTPLRPSNSKKLSLAQCAAQVNQFDDDDDEDGDDLEEHAEEGNDELDEDMAAAGGDDNGMANGRRLRNATGGGNSSSISIYKRPTLNYI